MQIDWAFQRNEDESSQGWNDPSIAGFKSNRLESLTREIIQNSLDAAMDNDAEVLVEFEESTRTENEIPNIDTLREIVALCDRQKGLQNPDMIKEFDTAKEIVKRKQISVLSVSDYFTMGMQGPCQPGKPFYQYLKTVGQSGGATNRAGSHGIGKAAPLACSDLRTIFVSTVWEEGGHRKSLVQGRAVLMSFKRDDGIYKSTGFWGDAKNYQAIEPSQVPEHYQWMVREGVGTSIHIIGWSSLIKDQWVQLVIGFAISNFFAAFLRGKLSIKVKTFEVNQKNLTAMANNQAIYDAMLKYKVADKLEEARHYIRCLTHDERAIKGESQITHLGRTTYNMILAEGAPRKIALIRNNMLITDAIPGFWKKVPGKYRDFVGLVEVLDEKGSQFIRLMEPPSHNALSVDWLPTAEDKKRGEIALTILTSKLRDFVEKNAGSGDDQFGKVDFMAEFFADEAGDDRGDTLTDERDPNGRFMFSPKAIKMPSASKLTLESELDEELEFLAEEEASGGEADVGQHEGNQPEAGGAGFQGGDGKIEKHGGPNDGNGIGVFGGAGGASNPSKTDRERDKPIHPIRLHNVRLVKTAADTIHVFATPSGSAKALVRVHEVGADFNDPFEVISSTSGSVEQGAAMLALTEKKRISFSLQLSRPIVGGLKLVASHCDGKKS